jgi:hypothetical protein
LVYFTSGSFPNRPIKITLLIDPDTSTSTLARGLLRLEFLEPG